MRSTQLSFVFVSTLSLANAAAYPPSVYKRAPPPANLAHGYAYKGCYIDVGRTINEAATGNAQMTNEACTEYCFNKGFAYAGTEWYNECYCGNTLAKGGILANEADCTTPCSGNAAQPCGGPNRLSLYQTSLVVGPSVNPGVGDWSSIGCYSEGTTGRALTYGVGGIPGNQMTVAKCTAACANANFILAGVEYSGECYCGNSFANGGAPAVDGCNMLCNGNASEYCGGPNRLNVYDFKHQYLPLTTSASTPAATGSSAPNAAESSSTVVSSASSAASTPSVLSQPATVGTWKWYGCQTEATGTRALNAKTFASDDMTLEKCATFCTGNTFFGVEYSRECWCGNSFAAGSVPVPGTQCSMKCMGNPFQYCGEGNRLSVYTIGDATQPSSAAPTGAATPTAAVPVASNLPTGWQDQGCWVDNLNGRILPNQLQDDPAMTLASCAQACASAGYTVAGAEYHTQCFCGNAIYYGGAPASDPTTCNTGCGGKPSEMCGGPNRMTIMSLGTPQTFQPPVPQKSGFNGSWTYQGCLSYENAQRPFKWQVLFPGINNAGLCLDRCAAFGYPAAGLEYGEECYCGDPANIAAAPQKVSFVDESQCNIVCPGNHSSICGGGARLSTYFWTGTKPLYSWTFGTDALTAGSYELLIGSLSIPLMTMETITGKVTFLEKFGTGPPNSTGAYELDLSLVPDISKAWREMHVKTDIFCSAGITLPDKAGRQLTLGGWSGDSTYGVRLYWPDGKPGTPGTNDWHEDVQNLRMQDGRWYPSSMIMANGSIFIIGGEEGANGRAVPTIEVMPFTGSKPLTMDWLARTDPNNLYPFVAVLPSEDIFVAYWNEARILDKVTFDTKAVLPNIPGSVNNPLAGRTYPLEGTGVLLPQHAPYTDPLGVLICGGSTEGPGFALDNCVSIEPEGANPKWVLERMPSARVISCMAPLPDGTYLINNGAQQGVAGFGLATNPNKNALLYDPAKPIGERITVMANTTIARMYHSESITLLDGRVLVTGSDPEDGVNPQEYRVEVFNPPYLTSKKERPTFTLANTDWAHGGTYTFSLGHAPKNGKIQVSLLGAVTSTHGNSLGARTIFPAVSCGPTECTVTAPPSPGVAPPGWYQFFVLDGGIPAVGVYIRIGGDPAKLGEWPKVAGFDTPGI
ncbi:WSC domain-containing protein [Colletotrichum higginsianum IMI 349063]|uniref:WSC domain-containing protein n=3 Tax=Colletotrichum higginsianum TaxID=80884 RepID=A0A1B7YUD3_COLHI|nr:WSC domain-containing protein [Colletotrichum higginsianum IMI 349063]OBR15647.1 WSC domain-containing protein [Colletotrichum higginsianum IMI 349063]TID04853.1 WSC domain-containing protein [Colletotrichum higginsianum]